MEGAEERVGNDHRQRTVGDGVVEDGRGGRKDEGEEKKEKQVMRDERDTWCWRNLGRRPRKGAEERRKRKYYTESMED